MQKRLTAYELTLAATLLAAWLALDAATTALNAVVGRKDADDNGGEEEGDEEYQQRTSAQAADHEEAWEVYVAVLEKVNDHAARVYTRQDAVEAWSAVFTETTIPEQGDHYDDVAEVWQMPEENVYAKYLAPAVNAQVESAEADAAEAVRAASPLAASEAKGDGEGGKQTPLDPSPTTTVMMSANGQWSRGRSLSEAVANMHKAGLKRGVRVLVWDVEWLGKEARDEARDFDTADATKPAAERIMSQPRVNDDGSPLAYVSDHGDLMRAPGTRSTKRGAYNHTTGKVTPEE